MAAAVIYSQERRRLIEVLLKKGVSFKCIAARLGQSKSSIQREVSKNGGRYRYTAVAAALRKVRKSHEFHEHSPELPFQQDFNDANEDIHHHLLEDRIQALEEQVKTLCDIIKG